MNLGKGLTILNKDKHDSSLINKLYGGLNMSWTFVVLFAIASAILTSVFLMVPVFRNTSFERMGVTLEAWFFFAIIIMTNCKKPLESALKTFVFFLISQPLIYLIQVLVSSADWSIFNYYKYWFLLTLATFPMAYAGWYLTKKNWLSALILSPVLAFLGITAYQSGLHCLRHFPYLMITCLFCVMQIILYVLAFLPGKIRIVGILVPIAAACILLLRNPQADVNTAVFLPDEPVLSDSAVVMMREDPNMTVTIEKTGADSMVRIQADVFGSADFVIVDGENEYRYTVEVWQDDAGHTQIQITTRED